MQIHTYHHDIYHHKYRYNEQNLYKVPKHHIRAPALLPPTYQGNIKIHTTSNVRINIAGTYTVYFGQFVIHVIAFDKQVSMGRPP